MIDSREQTEYSWTKWTKITIISLLPTLGVYLDVSSLAFCHFYSYLKMDINFPVFAKPSDENIQTWIVYSCNFYPQNSYSLSWSSVLLIVVEESSGLTAGTTRATPEKFENIWIDLVKTRRRRSDNCCIRRLLE